MSHVIQVLIVEDDARQRESLELDINRSGGLNCAGSFSSMEDALKALPDLVVDVAVLDIGLPGGMEGTRGAESVKHLWPRLRVLMLSGHETDIKILEAFAWGADGYLLKSAAPRERLAEAIRQAYDGGAPMSDRVKQVMRDFHHKRAKLLRDLSPMESRIMDAFDRGLNDKEMGGELNMSPNTVKEHLRRIVKKTLANSRGEASFVRRMAFL